LYSLKLCKDIALESQLL